MRFESGGGERFRSRKQTRGGARCVGVNLMGQTGSRWTMKKEEYQQTQTQLLEIMHTVSSMDLNGFVNATNRAESVGPILNPTLYRAGQENLEIVKRMAVALREFKAVLPSGPERITMVKNIMRYQERGF